MNGFGTRAVHPPGPARAESSAGSRSHVSPIYQTSAFSFRDADSGIAAFQGSGDYLYTRCGNPTTRALERHVASLEAAPVVLPSGTRAPEADVDSRFFTTGMAALTATFLGAAAGRRLVCQAGIFGTTEAMARRLRGFGMEVDFTEPGVEDPLARAIESGSPPALVHIETPSNPLARVTDIERAARLAHESGARLSVDGTFATPALQRPLAWGADFVIHSTTKFMSGQGVALGGVVTAASDLVDRLIDPLRNDLGSSPDPFAAWLTHLGLRTLDVRMERHVGNARALASHLESHPAVARVFYPGADDARRGQMSSGGPMLAFELVGGGEAALRCLDGFELITLAPTLGTLDTLVQHPYSMSHAVLPEPRRLELGITPGVIRVSAGLETAADLIADLDRALAAA